MLIVFDDLSRGFVIRDTTGVEWLLARVRADALDRCLAAGATPEANPLLAVRARMLVRPAVRRRFARSLRQVVQEAAIPRWHRFGILSMASRQYINRAAEMLTVLAERLESPCPVPACGVARVKLLLTDGAGPLYYAASGEELEAAIHDAIRTIDASMID